jgi:biotin synthase-related radical SAM superfamily protein
MTLSKAQIIAASLNGLKREVVPVPEWGGDVVARELTAAERDAYQMRMMATDERGQMLIGENKQPVIDAEKVATARLWLVAYGMIDEAGQRVFGNGDLELIGQMPNEIVERISAAVRRLSGLGEDAVEEAVKD